MSLKDLKVGDVVFVKRTYGNGAGFEAAITEVARKWATIGPHGRFDRETGAMDGGRHSSDGQVWRSRADYEAHAQLSAAWADIKRDLQWAKCPEGVTVERINQARRLLGLSVFGE
jgi:hypothetical protein